MRIPRMLALGASVLVLVSACSTGGGSSPSASPSSAASSAAAATASASASAAQSSGASGSTSAACQTGSGGTKPTVKVGSDGFYEAKIMAEIYAQALEAKGYKIDRAGIGIGARKVSAPALESGQIDLKPEYIGSGLAFYQAGKQTGNPAQNEQALQDVLANKGGGICVLNYSPAADQNAFVVRKATADQDKLTKLSDTTAVQNNLKWGLATDCKTNPVCAAALKSQYGLDPQHVTLLAPCSQPMVDALKGSTVDVGELCSTQPDIAQNGWVLLQDDKQTQPADNIAPLVRHDLLAKVDPSFVDTLNAVSAKMDTATLTQLNAKFSFDKQDVPTIAKNWLKSAGLVP